MNIQYMSFGDEAVTTKGLPNIPRGNTVHVYGVMVNRGQVCYCVVHNGQVVSEWFPHSAFQFRKNSTPQEIAKLIKLIS